MKEFAPFRLDANDQYLWRGDHRVPLTPKAFSVLCYLVDRAGSLVTQSELLNALWPGTYVQPEVLKSHIRDIRSALDDDANSPSFIETEPRRGYRFIAPVLEARVENPNGQCAEPTEKSVAVLPFTDMSSQRGGDYFGDGLAEDIINGLTKVPGLKVIARTSAFAFRGKNQDVRQIAELLNVTHVVEGSIRKEGSRVRITARLIAASDNKHIWSDRFDREMIDILAVQDEIASAISQALETKLSRPADVRPNPKKAVDAEAYQAYLEGRHHMHRVTPSEVAPAVECFQRAIQLDPLYALPHAGMAQLAYYRTLYMGARPRDTAPAALASLARALKLDPEAAEAHLVRGIFSAFYEWNWQAAGDHFARALHLEPSSARILTSRSLWHLGPSGRCDEALAEIRCAIQLDPLSPAVRNAELWALFYMRKEEALERSRATLKLFSSHWASAFISGLIFMQYGLHGEAASVTEAKLELVPGNFYLLALLALAYGGLGRATDSKKILLKLETRNVREYVPFLPRSLAAEACGDSGTAYELLKAAIEEREPLAPGWTLSRREDPHFSNSYRPLLLTMNLL